MLVTGLGIYVFLYKTPRVLLEVTRDTRPVWALGVQLHQSLPARGVLVPGRVRAAPNHSLNSQVGSEQPLTPQRLLQVSGCKNSIRLWVFLCFPEVVSVMTIFFLTKTPKTTTWQNVRLERRFWAGFALFPMNSFQDWSFSVFRCRETKSHQLGAIGLQKMTISELWKCRWDTGNLRLFINCQGQGMEGALRRCSDGSSVFCHIGAPEKSF